MEWVSCNTQMEVQKRFAMDAMLSVAKLDLLFVDSQIGTSFQLFHV